MAALYGSPGHADDLSDGLRQAWNGTIQQAHRDGLSDFGNEAAGRFLSATPLADGVQTPVTWLPVPRQALICLGRAAAQRMCDQDDLRDKDGRRARRALAGGREWHNEYCEYRVIRRPDNNGQLRPKRIEITTELREYWTCIAREDPDRLLEIARQVLLSDEVRENVRLDMKALYGVDVPPEAPDDRERLFIHQCAGSATKGSGRVAPHGPLNKQRALFMCHPINGLDDLFFITAFGAQPYARLVNGHRRPVPPPWLFLDPPYFRDDPESLAQLRDTYCRHADPASSQAAYTAAYTGRRVALADPPGVYIRRDDFDAAALRWQDTPIEDLGWVRWRRPTEGRRHQRLVVGPPDDRTDVFLDDITVRRGNRETPLVGGYQILEMLAVGPEVTVEHEPSQPLAEDDYRYLDPDTQSIRCGAPLCAVCRELATWRERFLLGAPGDELDAPSWRLRRMASTTKRTEVPA
jgi:hypothetical protein